MSKKQAAIMKWTLVRHSAWTVKRDPQFKEAVQMATLTSAKEVAKVERVGGLVFDDYKDADDREYAENYKVSNVKGLIPRVPGSFVRATVGGAEIYIPRRI